ncbi:methyltransferase domain-containing protein [Duganella sp. FT50W]|uniref:Methyltransferase domain-containing protein n=1 Tax=Duganella lactea TaxID=2692173 RepID=A0A6L8MNY3_9BURK|nr:methyltransferase domain-containing protein [Duganella lactea]MYM83782.1 methyltransferase domain-containing protein [Duganella lactea]
MSKSLSPAVRFDQPGHPPATITEFQGVRSLHLGTSWVQGAMRITKPDNIELEYIQMMMMWLLFIDQPRHIVQLGLGSAALTKFCYRRLPQARVTAIELNPNVIAMCQAQFALPSNDERLAVREMNAMDFVLDPANRNTVDVLQVDLYDEEARGPVLDSQEFYQGCADVLRDGGIMTTNVFGDDFTNYDKNLQTMELVFDAVVWLPEVHDANIVVIAFKNAPSLDFSVLYERAAEIKKILNLPAKTWVNGLKGWMLDQQ